MKLYFMKQSALDYMKANIGILYKNYFQFSTPDWIEDLFDYDPFEVFAEVPDFELASLDLTPGEIDLQNCKILYSKLNMLSESQASEERIWAGLCNKTFYTYLRTRWNYARKHLKKTADDASAILMRYFYKNTGRSGMFRNTLARCWWTGHLTYAPNNPNHWELLNAIGPEDLISKISDIFYSNTFSSNPVIVEGFCQGLKFFRDRGIRFANREHIRPTAQYINALGGAALLDMLTADEIKVIVIERMSKLINGIDTGIMDDLGEANTADLTWDMEDEMDKADSNLDEHIEEVNVDFADYLDALEQTPEIDLDAVLGELQAVEYGCKIHIHKSPDNTFFISPMPMVGGELNPMQKRFLGKPIGHTWTFGGTTYEIIDIRR